MILIYNGLNPTLVIIATSGEQFTVDWGDDSAIETFTGTGDQQYVKHNYTYIPGTYFKTITITGTTEDCKFTYFYSSRVAVHFDASEAPSLKELHIASKHESPFPLTLNLSNCTALELLSCNGNNVYDLDLSDCTSLKDLGISRNFLSNLDVSNTALETGNIGYNCLPLSQCYPIYLKPTVFDGVTLWKQTQVAQTIWVGESIDLSSEKEFGGFATNFAVLKGHWNSGVLAPDSVFSFKDWIFSFHSGGQFSILMDNNAAMPSFYHISSGIPIHVKVPVEEITNIPTTAIATIPLDFNPIVLPYDAPYIPITWSVSDTGTTGATITGSRLNTKAPGTIIVTATLKNATPAGDYTQDFTIEVKPLGIDDPAQKLSKINLYPNPTTGELIIESRDLFISKIEVLNMRGQIVSSYPFNILSAHHTVDISHLNNGTYFVRVGTNQGEIVRKVVKQ
ncbi:MAG: T9SS type A sorting domain-containing protein [Lentimicrobiaceae bacterium]|nr:T9SS type A sorting domain-containing protein [Lentimicrobiaceae bacterium]